MNVSDIEIEGRRAVLYISQSATAPVRVAGTFLLRSAFEVRQELLAVLNDPRALAALQSWCSAYLHDHIYKPVEQMVDELATAAEAGAIWIIKGSLRTAGKLTTEAADGLARIGGWVPQRDTKSMNFVDGLGRQVINWQQGAMQKPTLPLASFFVDQGLAVKGDNLLHPAYDTRLPLFFQGGAWDMQRFNGAYESDFVDFATVVIGLFAAAAGTAQADILEWQNAYARLNSTFKGEILDRTYTHLGIRNVYNTKLGYTLYLDGAVKGTN